MKARLAFIVGALLVSGLAVASYPNGGVPWSDSGGGGSSFTGGTLTSQVVFDTVTDDITAASAQDVRILGGTTSGSVVLRSIDNASDLEDSAGNVEGQIVTSSGSAVVSLVQGTGSTAGAVMLIGARGLLGSTGAVANGAITASLGESFNTSAGTASSHINVYGGGAIQFNTQQTITIADNGVGTMPTDTTAMTSSFVRVSCADANGCNYAPVTTGQVDGWIHHISSIGANSVVISDGATINVRGGASVTLAQNEMITCVFTNSINICEN